VIQRTVSDVAALQKMFAAVAKQSVVKEFSADLNVIELILKVCNKSCELKLNTDFQLQGHN